MSEPGTGGVARQIAHLRDELWPLAFPSMEGDTQAKNGGENTITTTNDNNYHIAYVIRRLDDLQVKARNQSGIVAQALESMSRRLKQQVRSLIQK